MLSLNQLNIDVEGAKKAHLNFFIQKIQEKIEKKTAYPFFYDFLAEDDHLEKIIIGYPQDLIELNDVFISLVNKEYGNSSYQVFVKLSEAKRDKCKTPIADFFKEFKTIINYEILKDDNHYNSYTLTHNLGIRTCVYCNRVYTLTKRKISKGRLMNPQLNHWFPQSKFHLLQISFFNLVPSCEICNSRVKSSTQFNLIEHFHPYRIADEEEKIYFNYNFGVKDKYRVFFSSKSDSKIKRTSEEMYIDQMYDAHQYELEDLIKMKQAYSTEYLLKLKSSFPDANLTDNEMYRFVFGTELDEKNFHKRPMSKFKHDILKELGVI